MASILSVAQQAAERSVQLFKKIVMLVAENAKVEAVYCPTAVIPVAKRGAVEFGLQLRDEIRIGLEGLDTSRLAACPMANTAAELVPV